ncbi:hypothetical protein [Candidatus Magnetominusculus xianensis]|uniref:hypothetical protein n=1 Tax=Candidatus Magnetominusculus xianensis TaxID=1748249 RepID=UPI0012EDFA16|nr:hypothetical protein [Candidatus Magnetominusculus xianensis]MBF0403028.1 hypothetical protein [Nitrospirota bacterium]
MSRLKELVPEETLRGKYIKQVEVLSQLRDLQDEVCKEAEAMAIMYDMERDVRFKQGLAEGQRKGLLGGIELGLELVDMVRALDSIDKLEYLKNLIKRPTRWIS